MMPVSIDGEQVRLAVITYKPPGAGPFPTMIFHRGSTGSGTEPSRFRQTFDPGALVYWFVARGWVVILPFDYFDQAALIPALRRRAGGTA